MELRKRATVRKMLPAEPAALDGLGLTLTRASGRYGRYMAIVEQLTATANGRGLGWFPRDIDLALFWLGKPVAAPDAAALGRFPGRWPSSRLAPPATPDSARTSASAS